MNRLSNIILTAALLLGLSVQLGAQQNMDAPKLKEVKGKKLLERLILAIKCFSLTSLVLRSHWSELVTWPYPTTVEQRSLFFLVPRKGEWGTGEALRTPMLPVSCQQSWQVFRLEFLVFVHFSFSIPVDQNVCAQLCRELPEWFYRGRRF